MGNGSSTINAELIENVTFVKQDAIFSNPPGSIRLALFRNQTIYFNQILQDQVLNRIQEVILPGGYLVLGIKNLWKIQLQTINLP